MPSTSMVATSNSKLLSEELEKESQKVRSMYEIGQSTDWLNGRLSVIGDSSLVEEEAIIDESEPWVVFLPKNVRITNKSRHNSNLGFSYPNHSLRPNSSLTNRRASTVRMEHELAGGIEDWEDIDGGDVDRYGFITMRRDSVKRAGSPEPRPPQRISTVSFPSIPQYRRRGLS